MTAMAVPSRHAQQQKQTHSGPLWLTREEIAQMLRSRGVFITAIICGFLAFASVVAAIVVLILAGKPVGDITDLVNLVMWALLYGKMRGIERNTNGTQTALINHAISSTPASGASGKADP
jgi:hypothetical protein